MFFKKNQNARDNILFIHTAGLGDLVYTYRIINNLELIEGCNFYLIVKKEHKELFDNYDGKFRVLELDYNKYRFNVLYKIKLILELRKLKFNTVYQLNLNRRITDDDLALHIGAEKVVALNIVEKKFPKLFKSYFDGFYLKILFKSRLEIGNQIELFLNKEFNITNSKQSYIKINEERLLIQLMKKIPSFSEGEFIVIHPLSISKIRSLDKIRLESIINFLTKNYNYNILLLGSEGQKKLLEKFSSNFNRVTSIAGVTTILESLFIVKSCKLFIGIDSAFTHFAKHFNVPRIIFSGGGPYGIMFPKKSYENEFEGEMFLFHFLECFGCNWHCIYKEAFCLTKINDSVVFNSLNKFLTSNKDFR